MQLLHNFKRCFLFSFIILHASSVYCVPSLLSTQVLPISHSTMVDDSYFFQIKASKAFHAGQHLRYSLNEKKTHGFYEDFFTTFTSSGFALCNWVLFSTCRCYYVRDLTTFEILLEFAHGPSCLLHCTIRFARGMHLFAQNMNVIYMAWQRFHEKYYCWFLV